VSFSMNDFDGMRQWLRRIPCKPKVLQNRLQTFDLMRYREAYEEIYQYMTLLGAKINT